MGVAKLINSKKTISFLLVAIMIISALSLSACNSNDVNEVGKIKTEENVRPRWLLEGVPAYDGGTLSPGKYNAGPGLMSDSVAATPEDSYMQTIGQTNADEFEQYINKLTEFGYEQTHKGQTEGNLYAQFAGDGKNIYAYYIDSLKIARVIDDRSSVPLTDYSYTVEPNGSTTIYQYGLAQTSNSKTTMNCGMLYVIKLADNSLFIIDGGHPYQATDKAAEGFMTFLHEITGTEAGETLNVAGWFITHAHNDHVALTAKVLHQYHNEFNLERIMFNFPSFQTVRSGYTAFITTWFKHVVNTYYPETLYIKPHTGMNFNLADMNIEVMYTHEDAVPFFNPTKMELGNFNSSSTILNLTFESGKNFMVLGDADTEAEKLVTEMYNNPETFKSDIVQVTHHNFNYMKTLYEWIAPSLALVPNSRSNANSGDNRPKLQPVIDSAGARNIYYEGNGTDGFSIVDGEWALVYEAKVIGGAYDGSGL